MGDSWVLGLVFPLVDDFTDDEEIPMPAVFVDWRQVPEISFTLA